jgi:hypothetical protein
VEVSVEVTETFAVETKEPFKIMVAEEYEETFTTENCKCRVVRHSHKDSNGKKDDNHSHSVSEGKLEEGCK